ncbi:MAG: DUF3060 domain-containing protein [Methylovirgula sp.]|uniref:beta strand repeat-containing protein n=1 Tax=Methylovirgula sp. TaxID=1978224 RepID=UPI0030767231
MASTTSLTQAQINALSAYAVGLGSEGRAAVPSITLSTENSGYTVGIMQWDFGERNAGQFQADYQNFLATFLASDQAQTLSEQQLNQIQAILPQTGSQMADDGQSLSTAELNALNAFVSGPDGLTAVNQLDQASINLLTSPATAAANLVATSGGNQDTQALAAAIAAKLTNQTGNDSQFSAYLQQLADNDTAITSDSIQSYITNNLSGAAQSGSQAAFNAATIVNEMADSSNPVLQATYSDLVDNTVNEPATLVSQDGLYDLGERLLTANFDPAQSIIAALNSGQNYTASVDGSAIDSDGFVAWDSQAQVYKQGTFVGTDGSVVIWNKDGTSYVIQNGTATQLDDISDIQYDSQTQQMTVTMPDGSTVVVAMKSQDDSQYAFNQSGKPENNALAAINAALGVDNESYSTLAGGAGLGYAETEETSPSGNSAVEISGQGDSSNLSNVSVSVASGSDATINGSADSISWISGSNSVLTLNGTSDVVAGSGGNSSAPNTLDLNGDGSSATVDDNADVVLAGQGQSLTIGSGWEAQVGFAGADNTVTFADGSTLADTSYSSSSGATLQFTPVDQLAFTIGAITNAAGDPEYTLDNGTDVNLPDQTSGGIEYDGSGIWTIDSWTNSNGSAGQINLDESGSTQLPTIDVVAPNNDAGTSTFEVPDGDDFYALADGTVQNDISNSPINLGSGFSQEVDGSYNQITAGAVSNVTVDGTGNSISASSGDSISLNSGNYNSVTGGGLTINVADGLNETIGGDGATDSYDSIIGSDFTLQLTSGSLVNLTGSGDTIESDGASTYALDGSNDMVEAGLADVITLNSGTGNEVEGFDGSFAVNLAANVSATIEGENGNITLTSGDTVNAESGGAVSITGTGDTLTGDELSVSVASGVVATIDGGETTIAVADSGSSTLNLSGFEYTTTAVGDTFNLAAGSSMTDDGGNNTIAMIADSRAELDIFGAGDVVSSTDNTITIGGAGSSATVQGSNNFVTAGASAAVGVDGSNNNITAGTSATLDIDGSENSISAGSGSTLWLNAGTGNNISDSGGLTINGAAGASAILEGDGAAGSPDYVFGSNLALTIETSSVVNLAGSGDTITAEGNGPVLINSGTGDTINGLSATIDFAAGISATVEGESNSITLGSDDNISFSSTYNSVAIDGTGDTISGADNTISAGGGAAGTIDGNGNTITLTNAGDATLTLSGTGDAITSDGNTLVLTGDSGATVTGADNTINLGDNSGAQIAVSGTGDVVSSIGNTITLGGSGSDVTVDGSGNTFVSDGSDATVTVDQSTLGTGVARELDTYSVGYSGSTEIGTNVTLTDGTSQITSYDTSNGDTQSITEYNASGAETSQALYNTSGQETNYMTYAGTTTNDYLTSNTQFDTAENDVQEVDYYNGGQYAYEQVAYDTTNSIFGDCPSSDNLRLIRRFEKRGAGSSGVRV